MLLLWRLLTVDVITAVAEGLATLKPAEEAPHLPPPANAAATAAAAAAAGAAAPAAAGGDGSSSGSTVEPGAARRLATSRFAQTCMRRCAAAALKAASAVPTSGSLWSWLLPGRWVTAVLLLRLLLLA